MRIVCPAGVGKPKVSSTLAEGFEAPAPFLFAVSRILFTAEDTGVHLPHVLWQYPWAWSRNHDFSQFPIAFCCLHVFFPQLLGGGLSVQVSASLSDTLWPSASPPI